MKRRFNNITWSAVMEAPSDNGDTGADDELKPTKYSDNVDVSEDNAADDKVGDTGADDTEDPGTDDTDTATDDTEDPGTDDTDTNADGTEDPGTDETDPAADDTGNENPEDEQSSNDNSANENNQYLVNDFIELYNRICEIVEKLNSNAKLNALRDPIYVKAKSNVEKLKDTTYDYISERFNKEKYVFNLYQFNLIIQAMNLNTEILSRSFSLQDDKTKKGKKRVKS